MYKIYTCLSIFEVLSYNLVVFIHDNTCIIIGGWYRTWNCQALCSVGGRCQFYQRKKVIVYS